MSVLLKSIFVTNKIILHKTTELHHTAISQGAPRCIAFYIEYL